MVTNEIKKLKKTRRRRRYFRKWICYSLFPGMAAEAAGAAETAEPADRACTEKNRKFLSIELKRRIFDGCSMTSKGGEIRFFHSR